MRSLRILVSMVAVTAAISSSLMFTSPSAARVATSGIPAVAIKKNDIYGFFFIKGTAPAGFKDIDHLNLGGSGISGAGATPPYYGQIRLKNRAKTDFKLNQPTLSGKHFSFTTKSVGGISYQFDGTLTRTDFDSPAPPESNEVVLRGVLKKMKGGKAVAHANLKFTWFVGD